MMLMKMEIIEKIKIYVIYYGCFNVIVSNSENSLDLSKVKKMLLEMAQKILN